MSEVSLRDYIERVLDERQRALEITATALHSKLEAMNEFRRQIDGERALYVRRDNLEPLEKRVAQLESQRANLDGRFWALGTGLGMLVVLLNLYLKAH